MSFQDDQIRASVKASSCGSSSGWHYIYVSNSSVNLDNNFHNLTMVYSRYSQYLKLYYDYSLIGSTAINSTNIASCAAYDAGFGYNSDGELLISSVDIWYGTALSESDITTYTSQITQNVSPTNS